MELGAELHDNRGRHVRHHRRRSFSGGGSFLLAGSVSQVLTGNTNTGNGFVSIELLSALPPPPALVSEQASAALLALGVAGLGALRRRRAA